MQGINEKLKTDNPAAMRMANYVLERAVNDDVLQEKIMNPEKTLSGMMAFVMSSARKQAVGNMACLSDEEVYGMCIHYFDESNEDLKKEVNFNNNARTIAKIEVTNAVKEVVEESKKEVPKMKVPKKVKPKKEQQEEEQITFDLFG